MDSTKILLAVLMLANAGLTAWVNHNSNQGDKEYKERIEEVAQSAQAISDYYASIYDQQFAEIAELRASRQRDSVEYQLMKSKLNIKINDLEKSVEEYRRRLVDLGDLPIY